MAIPALRIFLLFLLVILMACATNRALPSRGLTPEERRYFIVQNGFGIPEEHRKAFLEGFPALGMSQDMIYSLYGPPDRTIDDDTVWEYVNRKGKVITGFKFEEKEVVKIIGDPRGGVPEEEPEK